MNRFRIWRNAHSYVECPSHKEAVVEMAKQKTRGMLGIIERIQPVPPQAAPVNPFQHPPIEVSTRSTKRRPCDRRPCKEVRAEAKAARAARRAAPDIGAPTKGWGSLIAATTKAVGIEPCNGCEVRRRWLDRVTCRIARILHRSVCGISRGVHRIIDWVLPCDHGDVS